MSYKAKQRLLIDSIREQVSDSVYSASIISEQSDFDQSKKISLTSVCIPSNTTRNRIQNKLISPLRTLQPNHYYYSSDQLHLTIKNIRIANNPKTFTCQNVKQVQSLFSRLIPKFPVFDMELKGVLSFPTSLSVIGYTNDVFGKLVEALDDGLNEIGVPDDKHYVSNSVYFGNCTICRFQGQVLKGFERKVNSLNTINVGQCKVESINLVSCNSVFNSRTLLGTYYLK